MLLFFLPFTTLAIILLEEGYSEKQTLPIAPNMKKNRALPLRNSGIKGAGCTLLSRKKLQNWTKCRK